MRSCKVTDINTAALVSGALGVKLDLFPVSSTNRLPYLTAGKADLMISSLGKDAEREKVIDFSIAYAPFFSGVFGPEHLRVARPQELAARRSPCPAIRSRIPPSPSPLRRPQRSSALPHGGYVSGHQTELIATGNVIAPTIPAR